MQSTFFLGLDVGSTTVKLVLLDSQGRIEHTRYTRHLSDARSTLAQLLEDLSLKWPQACVRAALSGSGAITLAAELGLPFIQEVIASAESIRRIIPQTNVAIELGGEDAKITFFDNSIEQRMNETCAGGTGAFIDQMASYLQTDAAGLNELAKKYKTLYPIASRCGVFAKTDIMPLLNEGAAREDIAASIFQAVVDQTVSGLACGRAIRGNVALLGGPLHFLSELRERFKETLKLSPEQILFPDNAHYFVALGAAFEMLKPTPSVNVDELPPDMPMKELARRAKELLCQNGAETHSLPPLFESEEELRAFKERHAVNHVEHADLSTFSGNAYLGFDAGSTTMKAVLIDEEGRILFSHYGHNQGTPLSTATGILRELYTKLPKDAVIAHSGVTGYGSGLLRAAFGVDMEEVETIAHYKAADLLCPGVTFVLDIGGQDMKCLHATDGCIDSIMLNEACSAGCGVFIETFAQSLGMDNKAFVREALAAKSPVDLGSRCTVFMNSKVKQAQKEGAAVGDIAAGLAYSVIRNALYKVIKAPSVESLGPVIVAQGGSFLNDALLRAFELLLKREVFRPDIPGLMGAYGAASLARERLHRFGNQTTLITAEALAGFSSTSRSVRCSGCGNRCRLTINRFNDGRQHTSGNRCERGARNDSDRAGKRSFAPNLYNWKNRRLFAYRPLPVAQAPRGTIGIPRALNMFENYPFWHTFFTALGFRVELSAPSSKELFSLGLTTIPSQTVCYPAKLAHGHIMDLVNRGIKNIFFPCVVLERHEFPDADSNFNCPIVTSYPDILRLNIDALKEQNVRLFTPFLGLHKSEKLADRLHILLNEFLPEIRLNKSEVRAATAKATTEMERFKAQLRHIGERILSRVEKQGKLAIVLAGHPYHVDPEIHHGIPEMIAAAGVPVLTEDSVAHLGKPPKPLRVVDQWTYHSRLYRAASLAAERPNLEFVQFNSFGCGIDAVTTDQAQDILKGGRKNYTLLKIDEGSNLGAARIRIRSLLATVAEREHHERRRQRKPVAFHRVPFTREMKENYTILIPQFSPIHFRFLEPALNMDGYKAKLLPHTTKETVETGLRYVNNDACYPAIVVIGQLMQALLSGEYDSTRTALMISQTGGGCRASNYVGFLRKALNDAGLGHVPVISFNVAGLEESPGFTLSTPMIKRIVRGTIYGDLLARLFYRTRPYEREKGTSLALLDSLAQYCVEHLNNGSRRIINRMANDMVDAFASVPCFERNKPRVGMVGEILLKYHSGANNHAAEIIEAEGGEAVPTDITNFLLYSLYDKVFASKFLSGSRIQGIKNSFFIWWIERLRDEVRSALARCPIFGTMPHIHELAKLAKSMVGLGHQTGEGWLLTAEMIEFIREGVPNILCMQPFACLPNHCTGKGVIKELKQRYPLSNIAPVDYDPGASEVNQLNRIKLMMAVAHRNLHKETS